MKEILEPSYEGWQKLSVYQLNVDQLWLAETLKDAIDAAMLFFGRTADELLDELSPPQKIGRLERLVYGVELTEIEAAAGAVAVQKLNDGYIAPTMLGVLNR